MIQNQFAIFFAPESWSFARKFLAFAGPPFTVDSELSKGTAAVIAHREKYEIFSALANEIAQQIPLDREELERTGRTSGRRGRLLAALSEAMFAELYSSLDGMRRVVFSVYRHSRRVQNKSTLKLFELAAERQYGSEIPEDFVDRLAAAYSSWFRKLRRIRSETTHGETGYCWLDPKADVITYRHGLSSRGNSELEIDDVIGFSNATYSAVVTLTEYFFETHFKKLLPVEHRLLCGVYRGRMYERMVAPTLAVSIQDGRCWSRPWFDTEEGYSCPQRGKCAAYERPVSGVERQAYFRGGTS